MDTINERRGVRVVDRPLTFTEWMYRVDQAAWRAVGLSADDLPDCPYRRWYDEGIRPAQAARRAIRAAGGQW